MEQKASHFFQLECTRMYKYDAPNHWLGSGLARETNELVFALDGECIITIDGRSFIITPNTLMVFPKGHSYSNRLTKKKKFLYYQCHFDALVDGQPILEALDLATGNLAVTVQDPEAMVALFENALHAPHFHNETAAQLNRHAYVTQIIAEYIRLRQQSQPGDDAAFFDGVLRHMGNNLSSVPSLQQLAELVHLEPSYFIRRFTKTFGCPPMKYFDNLRIQRAMELLEQTDTAIPQIGSVIGIDDKYYFNKFFEKHCGMSPAVYRSLFR